MERTNTEYGALGIQSGTRVVFPNGSIDPWSALGITDNSTGNVAVFIQGIRLCYLRLLFPLLLYHCRLISFKERPIVPTCIRRRSRIPPS